MLLSVLSLVWSMSLAIGAESVRPVLVTDQFVDPYTGDVVGFAPVDKQYYAWPDSDSAGRYRLGPYQVDSETRSAVKRPPEEILLEGTTVTRVDQRGEPVWSTALGVRLCTVRPPDRLVHNGRVFVAYDVGIVALDYETGREIWRSEGPSGHLHASGALLVAVDCTSRRKPEARWLVARNEADGREAFRYELRWNAEPDVIQDVGDLLLVRDAWTREGYKSALLNHRGKPVITLDKYVARACLMDGDLLLVTNTGLARLGSRGQARWENPVLRATEITGARIIPLPGGDILAYVFCEISDSGIEVARVRGTDGRLVWSTECKELGVSHSSYSQVCYHEIRGGDLIMVSQGAAAHFVEILDLATGVSQRRFLVSRERPAQVSD
jgi:outer membrane protein assembly factor BamB